MSQLVQSLSSANVCVMSAIHPTAAQKRTFQHFSFVPIALQKSKFAGIRIFAKNPNREAIADTYNFNHVTEVAYEFNVRQCAPLTSLHEIRISSPHPLIERETALNE